MWEVASRRHNHMSSHLSRIKNDFRGFLSGNQFGGCERVLLFIRPMKDDLKVRWPTRATEALDRNHCIFGLAFNTLSPHFWCIWKHRVFFAYTNGLLMYLKHRVFFAYTNGSTLVLLTNSLFNVDKQNISFHCY